MIQLAQTTMRSELGKIALDRVFQERTHLNSSIVEAINHASEAWGINCMRYEIRDIQLPVKVKEAMQMQVEAERKKRAVVLESEGAREAAINRAEGLRQSKILTSEAEKIQQINIAQGDAGATLTRAYARAKSLNVVGEAVGRRHGTNAASLSVAEQYVDAFKNLAKSSNTVLLPEKTGDVSSMVAQAMAIYGSMVKPTSDGEDKAKEDGETPDFEKQMEEIVQQVENQSFISKEPAGMTLAPGSGEKGDVSSVLGSSDPVTRSPNTTGGSPHMTLASSLTKKWSEDP
jgi:valyl-tRNA synthetase